MAKVFVETNGEDFIIQASKKEAWYLQSLLEFIHRTHDADFMIDRVSIPEVVLSKQISSDIKDYLDDLDFDPFAENV